MIYIDTDLKKIFTLDDIQCGDVFRFMDSRLYGECIFMKCDEDIIVRLDDGCTVNAYVMDLELEPIELLKAKLIVESNKRKGD